MAHQYIYTMVNLRKVVPPQREILKGIYLSFFPGAKIGVLGLNGAGKSTLLKIMAGVEKDFAGEAFPAEGTRIGFLPQDPRLDTTKNVLGNVELGVAKTRGLLKRFEELNEKLAEEMSEAESDKVMAEYQRVQDAIEASNAWELDRQLELAMDALRLPPPDADVTKISGGEKRRVALCRILLEKPDLLLLDEPTNHLDAESVAWLERHLAEYPAPSSRSRTTATSSTTSAGWILELDRGAGIPWKGNYSSWLEQKEGRLELEEKAESAKRRTLQRELEWIKMSPRARHAKSKSRIERYEALLADQGPEGAARRRSSSSRPGRAWATSSSGRGREEVLRRPPPHGGPLLRPAARRHRRRHRRERRRQDDALQDDRRQGEARTPASSRSATRSCSRTSTRTATVPIRRRACTTRSPAGRTRSSSASARSRRAPTSRCSTSRARTSRSASATSRAAR
jgi:ATPase subunit of ABC transporter with duplicated ATPase domains